jgi:serine/threonine protein phosphatase PrpC
MGNTIEGMENPIGPEPVTSKETETGAMISLSGETKIKNEVKVGVSSMQGWRGTMEDTHLLEPVLKISKGGREVILDDHAAFGVFDGHGGSFTSEYVSQNIYRVMTARAEWGEYISLDVKDRQEAKGIELLKSILTGTFLDMDLELQRIHFDRLAELEADRKNFYNKRKGSIQPPSIKYSEDDEHRDGFNSARDNDNRQTPPPPPPPGPPPQTSVKNRRNIDRSGSTAVVILLTPSHIICSNAGDSRAILCRGGKVMPLSFDHKPIDAGEVSRITAAGGFIRMKRIDGDLAVSRGFGDFRFKINGSLPHEQQKVSVKPDILVYPRDHRNDEFVVLACDGIWDVVENADCYQLVQKLFDDGYHDLGVVCERMLDTCLLRDSKDNMTISVVTLPGCQMMRDKAAIRENLSRTISPKVSPRKSSSSVRRSNSKAISSLPIE